MLKMILADDEPVITRGIQKLVDWNSLGIEIVGEYEDGKAAMDGIVTLKPDIALLDIYMPKKTGIEILKECRELEIDTKIIFISGFQDFQYAKDALTYGAMDYLLKPVIREELVATIEKCILLLRPYLSEHVEEQTSMEPHTKAAYEKLVEVEECRYLPVLTEIFYQSSGSSQERKLIQFSALSFLEQYLEEQGLGIVFVKNGQMVIVLKNKNQEEAGDVMYQLLKQAEESMGVRLGFVIGETVENMGEIPAGYQRCLPMLGYFFFEDQMKVPVLKLGREVFLKPKSSREMRECRDKMIDAMIAQDDTGFLKGVERFRRLVCLISDGSRENACFHYGSTLRIIQERFDVLGVKGLELDLEQVLDLAREQKDYRQLTEQFEGYFSQYKERVRQTVASSDKKDILHAREYIEQHYMENLTLEVMAREIHMNPYYFSSFFKKNSGENFKDYLNKVRMKHAVSLLVSTDKRTSEIADIVGFRDGRSFSELFVRAYGETPASYRKRVKDS